MIQWFNKKMSKKRKGFTLIELVVVIAILGILAAIAIPRLGGSRANASRKALVATLRTVDSAISIAEADNRVFTDAEDLVELGYLAAEPRADGATIEIVDKVIVAGDDTATPPIAEITGKRAVASIADGDKGKFGITTPIEKKTIEELQEASSLWN